MRPTTHDEMLSKRGSSDTEALMLDEESGRMRFDTVEYHFYFLPASSVIWDDGDCYPISEYIVGAKGQHHIHIELNDLKGLHCSYPFPSHPLSTDSSDLSLLLELLRALYPSLDISALRDFLYRKEHIAYTLIESHSKIIEIFGDIVKDIKIEVIHDPEEDYSGVSLNIVTDIDPEEALALLHKFDDEWWLDVSQETRKLITIDVEL